MEFLVDQREGLEHQLQQLSVCVGGSERWRSGFCIAATDEIFPLNTSRPQEKNLCSVFSLIILLKIETLGREQRWPRLMPFCHVCTCGLQTGRVIHWQLWGHVQRERRELSKRKLGDIYIRRRIRLLGGQHITNVTKHHQSCFPAPASGREAIGRGLLG